MNLPLVFFTLLFAALGLAPGFAHLLEMPVKLRYPPEMYFQVTSTLYSHFGIVGSVVQVAALGTAIAFVVVSRRMPGAGLALAGAILLAVSLVAWGSLVQPVNSAWADGIRAATLTPADYTALRPRWEYGHLVAFVLWLGGFCALLAAALRSPR